VKRKPVVPRARATRDVDEALAWYLREATETVALATEAADRQLAAVA